MKGKIFAALALVAVLAVGLTAGPVGQVAADNTGERQFATQILIADIEGGKLRNEEQYYTDLTLEEIFAAVRCRKGSCSLQERQLWYSKALYLEVHPGYVKSTAVNLPTALGDKALVAAPHGPYWVKTARHLTFRVYLEGNWKYPVAVQAVFVPTDYNSPIQLGYKFATVTSPQRWVRFDFDLPQGGYKLFAYGGEAGKYSPYPYPVWAEAGPIPVRIDRDRDITITLDP